MAPYILNTTTKKKKSMKTLSIEHVLHESFEISKNLKFKISVEDEVVEVDEFVTTNEFSYQGHNVNRNLDLFQSTENIKMSYYDFLDTVSESSATLSNTGSDDEVFFCREKNVLEKKSIPTMNQSQKVLLISPQERIVGSVVVQMKDQPTALAPQITTTSLNHVFAPSKAISSVVHNQDTTNKFSKQEMQAFFQGESVGSIQENSCSTITSSNHLTNFIRSSKEDFNLSNYVANDSKSAMNKEKTTITTDEFFISSKEKKIGYVAVHNCNEAELSKEQQLIINIDRSKKTSPFQKHFLLQNKEANNRNAVDYKEIVKLKNDSCQVNDDDDFFVVDPVDFTQKSQKSSNMSALENSLEVSLGSITIEDENGMLKSFELSIEEGPLSKKHHFDSISHSLSDNYVVISTNGEPFLKNLDNKDSILAINNNFESSQVFSPKCKASSQDQVREAIIHPEFVKKEEKIPFPDQFPEFVSAHFSHIEIEETDLSKTSITTTSHENFTGGKKVHSKIATKDITVVEELPIVLNLKSDEKSFEFREILENENVVSTSYHKYLDTSALKKKKSDVHVNKRATSFPYIKTNSPPKKSLENRRFNNKIVTKEGNIAHEEDDEEFVVLDAEDDILVQQISMSALENSLEISPGNITIEDDKGMLKSFELSIEEGPLRKELHNIDLINSNLSENYILISVNEGTHYKNVAVEKGLNADSSHENDFSNKDFKIYDGISSLISYSSNYKALSCREQVREGIIYPFTVKREEEEISFDDLFSEPGAAHSCHVEPGNLITEDLLHLPKNVMNESSYVNIVNGNKDSLSMSLKKDVLIEEPVFMVAKSNEQSISMTDLLENISSASTPVSKAIEDKTIRINFLNFLGNKKDSHEDSHYEFLVIAKEKNVGNIMIYIKEFFNDLRTLFVHADKGIVGRVVFITEYVSKDNDPENSSLLFDIDHIFNLDDAKIQKSGNKSEIIISMKEKSIGGVVVFYHANSFYEEKLQISFNKEDFVQINSQEFSSSDNKCNEKVFTKECLKRKTDEINEDIADLNSTNFSIISVPRSDQVSCAINKNKNVDVLSCDSHLATVAKSLLPVTTIKNDKLVQTYSFIESPVILSDVSASSKNTLEAGSTISFGGTLSNAKMLDSKYQTEKKFTPVVFNLKKPELIVKENLFHNKKFEEAQCTEDVMELLPTVRGYEVENDILDNEEPVKAKEFDRTVLSENVVEESFKVLYDLSSTDLSVNLIAEPNQVVLTGSFVSEALNEKEELVDEESVEAKESDRIVFSENLDEKYLAEVSGLSSRAIITHLAAEPNQLVTVDNTAAFTPLVCTDGVAEGFPSLLISKEKDDKDEVAGFSSMSCDILKYVSNSEILKEKEELVEKEKPVEAKKYDGILFSENMDEEILEVAANSSSRDFSIHLGAEPNQSVVVQNAVAFVPLVCTEAEDFPSLLVSEEKKDKDEDVRFSSIPFEKLANNDSKSVAMDEKVSILEKAAEVKVLDGFVLSEKVEEKDFEVVSDFRSINVKIHLTELNEPNEEVSVISTAAFTPPACSDGVVEDFPSLLVSGENVHEDEVTSFSSMPFDNITDSVSKSAPLNGKDFLLEAEEDAEAKVLDSIVFSEKVEEDNFEEASDFRSIVVNIHLTEPNEPKVAVSVASTVEDSSSRLLSRENDHEDGEVASFSSMSFDNQKGVSKPEAVSEKENLVDEEQPFEVKECDGVVFSENVHDGYLEEIPDISSGGVSGDVSIHVDVTSSQSVAIDSTAAFAPPAVIDGVVEDFPSVLVSGENVHKDEVTSFSSMSFDNITDSVSKSAPLNGKDFLLEAEEDAEAKVLDSIVFSEKVEEDNFEEASDFRSIVVNIHLTEPNEPKVAVSVASTVEDSSSRLLSRENDHEDGEVASFSSMSFDNQKGVSKPEAVSEKENLVDEEQPFEVKECVGVVFSENVHEGYLEEIPDISSGGVSGGVSGDVSIHVDVASSQSVAIDNTAAFAPPACIDGVVEDFPSLLVSGENVHKDEVTSFSSMSFDNITDSVSKSAPLNGKDFLLEVEEDAEAKVLDSIVFSEKVEEDNFEEASDFRSIVVNIHLTEPNEPKVAVSVASTVEDSSSRLLSRENDHEDGEVASFSSMSFDNQKGVSKPEAVSEKENLVDEEQPFEVKECDGVVFSENVHDGYLEEIPDISSGGVSGDVSIHVDVTSSQSVAIDSTAAFAPPAVIDGVVEDFPSVLVSGENVHKDEVTSFSSMSFDNITDSVSKSAPLNGKDFLLEAEEDAEAKVLDSIVFSEKVEEDNFEEASDFRSIVVNIHLTEPNEPKVAVSVASTVEDSSSRLLSRENDHEDGEVASFSSMSFDNQKGVSKPEAVSEKENLVDEEQPFEVKECVGVVFSENVHEGYLEEIPDISSGGVSGGVSGDVSIHVDVASSQSVAIDNTAAFAPPACIDGVVEDFPSLLVSGENVHKDEVTSFSSMSFDNITDSVSKSAPLNGKDFLLEVEEDAEAKVLDSIVFSEKVEEDNFEEASDFRSIVVNIHLTEPNEPKVAVSVASTVEDSSSRLLSRENDHEDGEVASFSSMSFDNQKGVSKPEAVSEKENLVDEEQPFEVKECDGVVFSENVHDGYLEEIPDISSGGVSGDVSIHVDVASSQSVAIDNTAAFAPPACIDGVVEDFPSLLVSGENVHKDEVTSFSSMSFDNITDSVSKSAPLNGKDFLLEVEEDAEAKVLDSIVFSEKVEEDNFEEASDFRSIVVNIHLTEPNEPKVAVSVASTVEDSSSRLLSRENDHEDGEVASFSSMSFDNQKGVSKPEAVSEKENLVDEEQPFEVKECDGVVFSENVHDGYLEEIPDISSGGVSGDVSIHVDVASSQSVAIDNTAAFAPPACIDGVVEDFPSLLVSGENVHKDEVTSFSSMSFDNITDSVSKSAPLNGKDFLLEVEEDAEAKVLDSIVFSEKVEEDNFEEASDFRSIVVNIHLTEPNEPKVAVSVASTVEDSSSRLLSRENDHEDGEVASFSSMSFDNQKGVSKPEAVSEKENLVDEEQPFEVKECDGVVFSENVHDGYLEEIPDISSGGVSGDVSIHVDVASSQSVAIDNTAAFAPPACIDGVVEDFPSLLVSGENVHKDEVTSFSSMSFDNITDSVSKSAPLNGKDFLLEVEEDAEAKVLDSIVFSEKVEEDNFEEASDFRSIVVNIHLTEPNEPKVAVSVASTVEDSSSRLLSRENDHEDGEVASFSSMSFDNQKGVSKPEAVSEKENLVDEEQPFEVKECVGVVFSENVHEGYLEEIPDISSGGVSGGVSGDVSIHVDVASSQSVAIDNTAAFAPPACIDGVVEDFPSLLVSGENVHKDEVTSFSSMSFDNITDSVSKSAPLNGKDFLLEVEEDAEAKVLDSIVFSEKVEEDNFEEASDFRSIVVNIHLTEPNEPKVAVSVASTVEDSSSRLLSRENDHEDGEVASFSSMSFDNQKGVSKPEAVSEKENLVDEEQPFEVKECDGVVFSENVHDGYLEEIPDISSGGVSGDVSIHVDVASSQSVAIDNTAAFAPPACIDGVVEDFPSLLVSGENVHKDEVTSFSSMSFDNITDSVSKSAPLNGKDFLLEVEEDAEAKVLDSIVFSEKVEEDNFEEASDFRSIVVNIHLTEPNEPKVAVSVASTVEDSSSRLLSRENDHEDGEVASFSSMSFDNQKGVSKPEAVSEKENLVDEEQPFEVKECDGVVFSENVHDGYLEEIPDISSGGVSGDVSIHVDVASSQSVAIDNTAAFAPPACIDGVVEDFPSLLVSGENVHKDEVTSFSSMSFDNITDSVSKSAPLNGKDFLLEVEEDAEAKVLDSIVFSEKVEEDNFEEASDFRSIVVNIHLTEPNEPKVAVSVASTVEDSSSRLLSRENDHEDGEVASFSSMSFDNQKGVSKPEAVSEKENLVDEEQPFEVKECDGVVFSENVHDGYLEEIPDISSGGVSGDVSIHVDVASSQSVAIDSTAAFAPPAVIDGVVEDFPSVLVSGENVHKDEVTSFSSMSFDNITDSVSKSAPLNGKDFLLEVEEDAEAKVLDSIVFSEKVEEDNFEEASDFRSIVVNIHLTEPNEPKVAVSVASTVEDSSSRLLSRENDHEDGEVASFSSMSFDNQKGVSKPEAVSEKENLVDEEQPFEVKECDGVVFSENVHDGYLEEIPDISSGGVSGDVSIHVDVASSQSVAIDSTAAFAPPAVIDGVVEDFPSVLVSGENVHKDEVTSFSSMSFDNITDSVSKSAPLNGKDFLLEAEEDAEAKVLDSIVFSEKVEEDNFEEASDFRSIVVNIHLTEPNEPKVAVSVASTVEDSSSRLLSRENDHEDGEVASFSSMSFDNQKGVSKPEAVSEKENLVDEEQPFEVKECDGVVFSENVHEGYLEEIRDISSEGVSGGVSGDVSIHVDVASSQSVAIDSTSEFVPLVCTDRAVEDIFSLLVSEEGADKNEVASFSSMSLDTLTDGISKSVFLLEVEETAEAKVLLGVIFSEKVEDNFEVASDLSSSDTCGHLTAESYQLVNVDNAGALPPLISTIGVSEEFPSLVVSKEKDFEDKVSSFSSVSFNFLDGVNQSDIMNEKGNFGNEEEPVELKESNGIVFSEKVDEGNGNILSELSSRDITIHLAAESNQSVIVDNTVKLAPLASTFGAVEDLSLFSASEKKDDENKNAEDSSLAKEDLSQHSDLQLSSSLHFNGDKLGFVTGMNPVEIGKQSNLFGLDSITTAHDSSFDDDEDVYQDLNTDSTDDDGEDADDDDDNDDDYHEYDESHDSTHSYDYKLGNLKSVINAPLNYPHSYYVDEIEELSRFSFPQVFIKKHSYDGNNKSDHLIVGEHELEHSITNKEDTNAGIITKQISQMNDVLKSLQFNLYGNNTSSDEEEFIVFDQTENEYKVPQSDIEEYEFVKSDLVSTSLQSSNSLWLYHQVAESITDNRLSVNIEPIEFEDTEVSNLIELTILECSIKVWSVTTERLEDSDRSFTEKRSKTNSDANEMVEVLDPFKESFVDLHFAANPTVKNNIIQEVRSHQKDTGTDPIDIATHGTDDFHNITNTNPPPKISLGLNSIEVQVNLLKVIKEDCRDIGTDPIFVNDSFNNGANTILCDESFNHLSSIGIQVGCEKEFASSEVDQTYPLLDDKFNERCVGTQTSEFKKKTKHLPTSVATIPLPTSVATTSFEINRLGSLDPNLNDYQSRNIDDVKSIIFLSNTEHGKHVHNLICNNVVNL